MTNQPWEIPGSPPWGINQGVAGGGQPGPHLLGDHTHTVGRAERAVQMHNSWGSRASEPVPLLFWFTTAEKVGALGESLAAPRTPWPPTLCLKCQRGQRGHREHPG